MPVGTAATVKAVYADQLKAAGADIVLGQHLPPDAAAGRRAHRRARRPAQLHALGSADPHRLRRLPGDEPRQAAQDHRRGRRLPVAHRRLARTCSRPSGRSRSSACSAPTSRCNSTSAWRCRHRAQETRSRHAALAGLGRALPRGVRAVPRARAGGPGQALFGIVQGGIDAELRQRSAEALVAMDLPGYADRRAGGGRAAGGDAGDAGDDHAAPAGGQAALPDGRRHADRPDRERRARHRHVRLRDADPLGPPRPGLHLGRQGQPAQRPLRRRSGARSMRRAAARRRATTAAPTCITSSSRRSIWAPCCCPGPTSPSTRS